LFQMSGMKDWIIISCRFKCNPPFIHCPDSGEVEPVFEDLLEG
jgi:hypothetical protein